MPTKPKSLLDKDFKYVSSNKTDIRKTFARARKELALEAAKNKADEVEIKDKVIPMVTKLKYIK